MHIYSCSVSRSCPTLCHPKDCTSPDFLVLPYLPDFAQIHAHCISDASNYLIFCLPLLFLPPVFPSMRVFSNEPSL